VILLVAIALGAVLGAVNGLLVWKLGIPPIVVTLGTLTIYRGSIFLIAGGIGTAAGAVLGALFLGVIKNALPVIGISPFAQMAISGVVIILAVVFNARAEKKKGRIILRERAAKEKLA
jgi:ribose/xylose/arabinose/galactoside ABC-type transport system permease subunit